MYYRIIAAVLISVWLILVLIGKGGLVHTILLFGLAFAAIALVSFRRERMTKM